MYLMTDLIHFVFRMCIFRCWHEHQNTQVSDSLRAQWRKWRHWSVWRASWRDLIQTEPGSTHQNVSLRLLWASHLLWYLYHMERCPGLLVEKVWGSKECVTSSMSVCSVEFCPPPAPQLRKVIWAWQPPGYLTCFPDTTFSNSELKPWMGPNIGLFSGEP